MRERARSSSPSSRTRRPRWTATRSRRRGAPAWIDDDHFTFLGYREYELVARTARTACGGSRTPAWASCASARTEALAARSPSCPSACARSRASRPLVVTKANTRSTVPPARLPGLRRRQALRRRRPGDRASAASSASTRRPPTAPTVREIPVLRRKVEAVMERAGLPARQPRREGAARDPRDLPARRALPDRRGRAVRDRHGHPRPRRAPARAAVRPPRPASSASSQCLVFLPRDRFNTRNRERVQEILRRGLRRRERRLRAAPLGVGARAHPLHRCAPAAAACRPTTAARSRRGSPRPRARGATTCARRSRGVRRGAGTRCSAATATRSRSATATTGWPARRSPTSGASSASAAARTSRVAVYRRSRRRRRAALQALPPGEPVTLSDVLPMFENMGLEVADERPYEVTRATARRRGSTTSACGYTAAARSTSTRCASASRRRSSASGAARSRTTASTGWCSARAWTGATSPCCGRSRATCARPRSPSATATWSRR